jgi:hypothetical protein
MSCRLVALVVALVFALGGAEAASPRAGQVAAVDEGEHLNGVNGKTRPAAAAALSIGASSNGDYLPVNDTLTPVDSTRSLLLVPRIGGFEI